MVGPRSDGRRNSLLPILVAGILTLVLVVAGFLLSRSGGSDAVPGTTPGVDNPCPDLLAARHDESPTPLPLTPIEGDLPTDADRLWLCGDDMSHGPAEPLTTDVATAITAFNDLSEAADQPCTEEYRLTYLVAIDHDDQRSLVRGELHGCRTISDGEHLWSGGEEWLTTLRQLWTAQRTAATAPTPSPAPDDEQRCEPFASLIPPMIAQLTSAVACGPDGATELDPELVTRVTEELTTATLTDDQSPGSTDQQHLALFDAWGSTLTLIPTGTGFSLTRMDADGEHQVQHWTPSPELAEQLRALW